MDKTSDKQPDFVNNVPLPAAVTQSKGSPQPDMPQLRRMTRGMMAAGGVIPPVAAPAKRKVRVQKPIMTKKEEPDGHEDTSSQGKASTKKTKGSLPDTTDPWGLNRKGVPDMDKLVHLLTRGYTKIPDGSDFAEAAHKYKWRGIGPGKHTLWELRGITLSEKVQARKKARENPQDKIAQIKLSLCEEVFSHIVSEWEAERYSRWRGDLNKMKMN
ncbi:hypothetical protein GE21DRAFT_9881 [Neurospora crassa]|uniref:Uncharacterized protein n=1 Tax=Neurospora crassa (strain ATCC 24698 / 74-OR23-1A / CBS 708.71 / DSM 1257 / FGSC 987) TaxID=367110 RepID=V5IKC4_NEUCR|nr:hypothetical protein NCU12039 [Neurospora crassa OR74A]ESA41853.1 hypothetical protein NCU12039 [Neurospora crassa OR74A]KHE81535.1 hypothetical protein GE21DRAFT_9881 [Neurospora crassa]|eukprot:XP_011395331.1 hypothetical protein NCU12039 [Neurospora crassa OR74A]